MATHIVSFIPTRYSQVENPRPSDQDSWEAGDGFGKGFEVLVENRYQRSNGDRSRHGLHFLGNDNVNRKVYQGPVEQKAFAFLVPLATVIAKWHPKPTPTITVEIGDLIVDPALDVVLKVVSGGRSEDTKIEIVHARPATLDHSEYVTEANKKSFR